MNLERAKRLKRSSIDIYNTIIHVFLICDDIIKTRRGIKIDCLHDAAFACPKMCWKYSSNSQLVGRGTNKRCMYSCLRYHTYTMYYCKLLVLFTAIIKARLGRWLYFSAEKQHIVHNNTRVTVQQKEHHVQCARSIITRR